MSDTTPSGGGDASASSEAGEENRAEERPPGPDGLPVLGNTFAFLDDPLAFWTRTAREHGPVAYYELGTEPFFQLSDPDLVQQVLVHDNERYRKGELFMAALEPPLGNGLLTSEGSFWRRQRHAIQPAFAPDRLDAYADAMVDRATAETAGWSDGEVRNVHDDMMSLTVEVAAEALFGVDVTEFEDAVSDALGAVMDHVERRSRRPVDVPVWLPTPGNRRYRRALATLEEVADAVVDRQLAAADSDGATDGERPERTDEPADAGPGPNVVRLLRESDEADASREQLRDEVVTLLLAGHETTALTLTYACHQLGRHPEVAERLRAEVDDVLGDRDPTVADLAELDYTERVVKETMRLYPPVHELLREPTEDVTLGGYRIPAGSTVSFQQWVLHRDPAVYDAPTEFRPERWTEELTDSMPAFSYFPFGGGPRRCVGDRFAMMEARLVLATLARDWTFDPLGDLSFAPSITLRPDGPVEMRVERR
ncbi:cytochrome P450 [Haloparvum sedimenti]|uniref:cytochrome P450 n=1 Tax=Haloparvum sedimenti TaxID=1678448 RepID=UPI00071E9D91|nr:cytochrome P450 [Haloparvum sedimenti]